MRFKAIICAMHQEGEDGITVAERRMFGKNGQQNYKDKRKSNSNRKKKKCGEV